MTVAVFAVGVSVPDPPEDLAPPVQGVDRSGVRHTFTSSSGVEWDLSDPSDAGVLLTDQGLRGLHLPPQSDFVDEAAGVDGQHQSGFRVNARDVFWPLLIWSDGGSQAWLDRDAAWWRGLYPGQVGTWTATRPDGSWRSLRVRCVDDGQGSFGTDPSSRGWQVYGVKLIADDPYWRGRPIVVPGGAVDGVDFIDPEGSPPFHISGGAPLAGMSISNPGDVTSWPIWRAVGPHPDLVVGIGSRTIECPPLSAGEQMVLDTSPWVRQALVDGVDATDELGDADFAPIPAGQDLALFASSSGAGTVSCEIVPRFYRAW